MGRALLEAGSTDAATAVAAALEVAGSAYAGRDAGEFASGAKGVRIGIDIPEAVAAADVLIDFTRPAGTLAHLAACKAAGKAIVIGTTGFDEAQRGEIRAAGGVIPVVFAPNFSIGMLVMFKLVDMASRALGPDYDVEVFEAHHRLKVDAPSGTALRLGEVAAAARGTTLQRHGVFARHGATGERKPDSIGFSVVRGGDMVGDHTVYFAGTGERVEITHRSTSRATFAQCAVRAAKWLAGRAPGLYDMEDVLGLRG